MLGVVLLAVLATPAPSPSPLKTISHVRTSPFCSAFNGNIRHSVEGLLANDRLFTSGAQVLGQTGHDLSVGFSAHVQLDVSHMETLVDQVVHNLDLIEQLLNALPPADTSTEDGRALEKLRSQLFEAAKQQNLELNALSGAADTIELDGLQNYDVSFGGALAANKSQKVKNNGILLGGAIERAGRTQVAGIAAPILALDIQQSAEIAQQQGLAQTLVQASERCK